MKRSPQPQGRTTLKSRPPFEPHSWPSCLVGREISCQRCLPTTAAYRTAPRKRSHSRPSTMNRSFQLYVFPGGKRSTSLWVCMGDTPAAEGFWNSPSLICLPIEGAAPLRRGKSWYLQASLEKPHLTSAPMWSRLFFIFTLYEANGICSWLTSNLEKWSSLGLQLAGLRLLVVLKWVRQQQVFTHKSRARRSGYERESLGSRDSQQAQRQTAASVWAPKVKCWCLEDTFNPEPELSKQKIILNTRRLLTLWRGSGVGVKAWTPGARWLAFEPWLLTYWLCDFEQVPELLCASISSSVIWE